MGFAVDQSTLREWAGKGLVDPAAVGLQAPDAAEDLDAGEKQFMADVERFARKHGWKVYHTRDSRKSAAGFPDLLMLRGQTLIVAELKTATGKATPEQLEWLKAFKAAGIPAYLWRPRDWCEIGRVLGGPVERAG